MPEPLTGMPGWSKAALRPETVVVALVTPLCTTLAIGVCTNVSGVPAGMLVLAAVARVIDVVLAIEAIVSFAGMPDPLTAMPTFSKVVLDNPVTSVVALVTPLSTIVGVACVLASVSPATPTALTS
jgi:hypothetical protein